MRAVCCVPGAGSPEDWEFTLDVNTLAPMRLTRRLAPGMADRGGGTIINIGSGDSGICMEGRV